MTSLPFELYKNHKSKTRAKWKVRGIKIDPDDFDYVYNEYIHATNCDLCNKLFLNTKERHLDHDHKTGEIRNICCRKCNMNKLDCRAYSNTKNKFISKIKNKEYTIGYCFQIRITRDGKQILGTTSTTLENAILIRDKFIEEHPEIFS
jgi:hypothetical protein